MKPNLHKGLFIALSGLDGCGLSTQGMLLAVSLSRKGLKVHLTKEPTDSLIGGLIRGVLRGDWKTSSEALQLMFAADRANHLKNEIIPALKRGEIVVCDRYAFSSIAYGSQNVNFDWLVQINNQFILPDLTFLIKVPPKICIMRLKKVRYSFELYEEEEKQRKIWQNYEKIAEIFPNIHVINGEQKEEKVLKEIIKIVDKELK